MDDGLKCGICGEYFKHPKVLSCLHTYCSVCLKSCMHDGELKCSACCNVTRIEDGDVSSLPDNPYVSRQLQILELQNRVKTGECLCSSCGEIGVVAQFCQQCSGPLCNLCTTAHRRMKPLKEHKIIPMEEIEKNDPGHLFSSELLHCPKHRGEHLKLFCESCDGFICRDCTILDHKGHDYLFAKDAGKKHRDELMRCLVQVKVAAVEEETTLEVFASMKSKIESRTNEVVRDVTIEFDNLIEALVERKQSLLEQVEEIKKKKLNAIACQENNVRLLMNTVNFVEKFIENGTNSEVLSLGRTIKSRLIKLRKIANAHNPAEGDGLNFSVEGKDQLNFTKLGLVNGMSFDSQQCEVVFLPQALFKPGETVSFRVVTKNSDGLVCGSQFDKVDAYLEGEDGKIIPCNDEQESPGVWLMSCHVHNLGIYSVQVKVNDVPVHSHFSEVKVKRTYSRSDSFH